MFEIVCNFIMAALTIAVVLGWLHASMVTCRASGAVASKKAGLQHAGPMRVRRRGSALRWAKGGAYSARRMPTVRVSASLAFNSRDAEADGGAASGIVHGP